MASEVRIPSLLQRVVGGNRSLTVEGETLAQLFDNIEKQYPGFKSRVLDEDGKLRHFVSVFVNDEDVRFLKELNTPIAPGDVVSILPAVAGGDSRD